MEHEHNISHNYSRHLQEHEKVQINNYLKSYI